MERSKPTPLQPRKFDLPECSECAELQQQLADARLLARAVNMHNSPCWWRDTLYIARRNDTTMQFNVEFCDNLPILTDEGRAALRKTVGE